MPVITVKNLSKKYIIYHQHGEQYVALRDVITLTCKNFFRWARRPLRKTVPQKTTEEFWALRDINCEVEQGERIGIIGSNGAGKSTFLKILSKITEPTSGQIKIKGRVASLLEVGTGFHPELTGRENIYLNGAILGMSRHEIREKFDEIVAFAEIEKFLDTPVKRYSSGMYVRLAFSVAAHLESDILMIDEVLAVGDVNFQKKCIERMQSISSHGRTLFFVSHNMQAISNLTTKCMFLERGRIKSIGDTDSIIREYTSTLLTDHSEFNQKIFRNTPQIISVKLETSHPNNFHEKGKEFNVTIIINTPVKVSGAALSFQINSIHGQPLIHCLIMDSELSFCREAGRYSLKCFIPKLHLYPGSYNLTVHFAGKPGSPKFEQLNNICPFTIFSQEKIRDYYGKEGTAIYFEENEWRVRQI